MRELLSITTIVAQVTNRCPCDCPQCYASKGNENISLKKLEEILDATFRNRVGLLQITGGEPMCYPQLTDLVKFCRSRKIHTAVATSGYTCTENVLNQLVAAGLDLLCVSLNGSIKTVHEQTRNDYESAINAIILAKKCGLPCAVNWVACNSNADDFQNVLALCVAYSVSTIFVLKKHLSFNAANEDYPTNRQLRNLRQAIENNTTDVSVIIEPCFSELQTEHKCLAGDDSFYVDCNGMISPCSMLSVRYSSPREMLESKMNKNSVNGSNMRCLLAST